MTSKDKYNQDIIRMFFVESREMLVNGEELLLDIEKGGGDKELLDALFRTVHTIKGSAGMFDFTDIEDFTHIVENILDDVRNEKISIDSNMISLLLDCNDHISNLLSFSENPDNSSLSLDENLTKTDIYLRDQLNQYFSSDKIKKIDNSKHKKEDPAEETDEGNGEKVLNECWHISIRFGENLFRSGLDPQSFISYLKGLGDIKGIVTLPDALPSLEEMDSESCYFGLEIDFKGNITKEEIEDVFEFMRDDCEIKILPPKSNISDYVQLIFDLPESAPRIGEILQEIGTLTESELEKALDLQKKANSLIKKDEPSKLLGDILLEEKIVQKPVLDAALEKQERIKGIDDKSKKTIRVDAQKLDNLINLVGELVITSANIKQLSEKNGDADIVGAVSVMSRLIEDIRDSTMNVRMVQIGETFKRFERVVRDLSRDRGKNIKLVISGGETELDKTLIEKITDPLMHLVRNAIDHGIGSSEERLLQGKPERGSILLNAYHETGSIVIEVKDDGEGLNREKIFAKAVDKELIKADQNISDNDLFQLIFEPGFSTAGEVTNISGRGVGMDVVKRNIESLRGSVVLNTIEGEGTTIRIHLPLTLAIIDGFMVEVGDFSYVLPLDIVTECTDISKEDIGKEGGNFINLRGEVLPFMRLRDFFGEEGDAPEIEKIVVIESSQKKAGLVVDRLIGEFQTVVKPLGKIFSSLDWISGSTILGTGDVALILDVSRIIKHMQQVSI
ncbi:MAG: chemotaxis protein CheA [Spirochaetota bacterium]|nr:chemotaxis protein CheA [Spirochaetota bacterium]